MGELPKRKNIRIKDFDYSSAGFYYVTICVDKFRKCLSEITAEKVILNKAGMICIEELERTPVIRKNLSLVESVIMPNHLHFILELKENNSHLGRIIAQIKSATTKRIKQLIPDFKWQRNYYEHVVRSEESLNKIRQYIVDNPLQWAVDEYNK